MDDNLTINTGDQNDLLMFVGVEVGKNLRIDTGTSGGNPNIGGGVLDSVSLGNTEVFGRFDVRSSGLAHVSVYAENSLLQPSRFHGPASFRLGSGSVDVGLAHDPGSRVVFDGVQNYIGLNATIGVTYGSNVAFQLNKRHLVNATVV